jgi:hypothetical protein
VRKSTHNIKVMRLPVEECIRRFLLHVLPKGSMRIRHYGLLVPMGGLNRTGRSPAFYEVQDEPLRFPAPATSSHPA